MRFFLDTEFIEGFHKPFMGKRRHFIDLISIGMVCEDGREYSAISREYNFQDASEWVKAEVILPLYLDTVHGDMRNNMDASNFHQHIGKSNAAIVSEILQFVCPYATASEWAGVQSIDKGMENYLLAYPPVFYAYYSAYDWVLFCSLFGTMMDLPKGFPMYCNDLKQTLDEKARHAFEHCYTNEWENHKVVKGEISNKGVKAFKTFEEALEKAKKHPNYPQQTKEHNALADAQWNKALYEFLKTV